MTQNTAFTNTTKTIAYTYDAAGQRLRKAYYNGSGTTTTDYAHGFVYTNSALEYLSIPEGRMVLNRGEYEYQFNITDHLGNLRSVLRQGNNGKAELLEEHHYYPFGLEMPGMGYVKQGPENKYRFIGKELQDENNLSMLDFGARMYDPQVGRWWSVDPMAEKMNNFSPYVYTFNNPINFVDIKGMIPWPVVEYYIPSSTSYVNSDIYYERGINSGWYRNDPSDKYHGAVDIAFADVDNGIKMTGGVEGASVMSTHDGVVTETGNTSGQGNYVFIQNGNLRTQYLHLKNSPEVKNNETVKEGQKIGILGNTGDFSTGPHLHYVIQIWENGKWVSINPVEGDPKHVKFSDKVTLKDAQKLLKIYNSTPKSIQKTNQKIPHNKDNESGFGIDFLPDGSFIITGTSKDDFY